MKLFMQQDSDIIEVPDDFQFLSGWLNDFIEVIDSSDPAAIEMKRDEPVPLDERFSGKHVKIILDFLKLVQQTDLDSYNKAINGIKEKTDCEKYSRVNMSSEISEFFKQLDKDDLFMAMNCANFMIVELFVSYSTSYVSQQLYEMSLDEMREYLNERMDFDVNDIKTLKKDWPLVQLHKDPDALFKK